MEFELAPAVGKPVGVVERQAPLPEVRLHLGTGLDERVELQGGCLGLAVEEQLYRVVEEFLQWHLIRHRSYSVGMDGCGRCQGDKQSTGDGVIVGHMEVVVEA